MNERLKELIKEAGISTAEYYRNLDDTKRSYSKRIVNEWSDEFQQQLNLGPYLRVLEMEESSLEKFAQLIVKECAKVANDNFDKGFCPVGEFITEHFGVE